MIEGKSIVRLSVRKVELSKKPRLVIDFTRSGHIGDYTLCSSVLWNYSSSDLAVQCRKALHGTL